MVVFVDPFEEYNAERAAAGEAAAKAKEEEEQTARNLLLVKPKARPGTSESTVGKYIAKRPEAADAIPADSAVEMTSQQKPKPRAGFGDFSAW